MNLLKAFTACFSTYSRIPMPCVNFDSDDMKYSIIFFPAIGIVIGIVECLLYALEGWINIPKICIALMAAVIPLVITGGIHVDGFMDMQDALNSYGDKEKKLQIMKDPNTGAFAVIKLATFGLVYITFAYLLKGKYVFLYALSFVISRTLSGISVCSIKGAKTDGMLYTLKENSKEKVIINSLIFFFAVEMVLAVMVDVIIGVAFIVASVCVTVYYKNKCIKNFGGITGDTSGWFLCIMELSFLIIAALGAII